MSVKNWYAELKTTPVKRDKNFAKHLIEPRSMIMCIGGTGSGKTNALVDFLFRKNDAFHQIIIFSGSTTEEPLYQFLKKKMPEIEMYTDIEELPELVETEDMKSEKLIVFDDFINLKPKEMAKINKYLTAGRKFGWTCFLMAQNATAVPKTILRNVNYFIIFRLNEAFTINYLLKQYNAFNVPKEMFLEYYQQATKEKFNFFLIDMRNKEYALRHNWTDIYPIPR
jgi:hypothetical protein